MNKVGKFIVSFLAGCLSVTAFAKDKVVEIKPHKAYLLVQVEPVEFQMLGTNRMKIDVGFARYDVDRNDIRGGYKANDNPVPQGESVRAIARKSPIAKDGKSRLYLLEVEPDIWVIESAGVSSSGTLGVGSTSFSLGSYHFAAKAGQITDLGVFVPGREASGNPDEQLTAGKLLGMALLGPFAGPKIEPVPVVLKIRERTADDVQLPAWLQNYQRTYPKFVYGSSFGNYGGGLVNRIDGREGRERATGETVYASMPEALKSAQVVDPEGTDTTGGSLLSKRVSSKDLPMNDGIETEEPEPGDVSEESIPEPAT